MPTWETLGPVKLAQADALAALADLSPETIDALIIDPPYCAGGFTEGGRTAAKGMGVTGFDWFQGDNMTTPGLVWLLRNVAIEAHRVLADRGSLLVFCDWRMVPMLAPALESSGLRWRNMVVWDKQSPGQGFGGFRAQHEIILHFVKGAAARLTFGVGNVIAAKRVTPKYKNHPTEKPGDVLTALIRATTPEGGTVADVFCGGGSLGAAAIATGRRAILSDASATHVASARGRLAFDPTRLYES
jgi:site-specific DNA-methyltransferase (adenine-specific)